MTIGEARFDLTGLAVCCMRTGIDWVNARTDNRVKPHTFTCACGVSMHLNAKGEIRWSALVCPDCGGDRYECRSYGCQNSKEEA